MLWLATAGGHPTNLNWTRPPARKGSFLAPLTLEDTLRSVAGFQPRSGYDPTADVETGKLKVRDAALCLPFTNGRLQEVHLSASQTAVVNFTSAA
jgi:hypothetical protein